MSLLKKIKEYLIYPEIIEKQNILNSLSIKEQTNDHVITRQYNQDYDQLYKDTEYYNGVFDSINTTKLSGGKIALQNLLNNITNDSNILQQRQSILESLDIDYISSKLTSFKENIVLYWLLDNSYADELYNIVYYSNYFLKNLNNIPAALSAKNIYKIVLSPLIGIVSPIIYGIIPYIVLVWKFKIKFSFIKYIKLIFKFYNTSTATDMLFGGGGSSIFKYISSLSTIFSFVFYFQGLFNSVEIARTLYNTSKHIIRIINTVLDFKKDASSLLCAFPIDLSSYQINIGSIKDTCSITSDFCLNFGRKLHAFKNLDKSCIRNLLTQVYYMDALVSLKSFKTSKSYCFSEYNQELEYNVLGLCHPSLKNPVENDMTINTKSNAIITSGNSSGKSILIKSLLINTLLGQTCGISCCTELSKFKPFHNILSCIHVPDITGHASLFEAEMHRSKYILDIIKSNDPTIIVMDEIFNSTNPLEAIAAAYAVCKKISEYPNVLLIFTTHLSYLTKLAKTKRFINYRMQTIVDSDKITFTYKLERGINRHYLALELLKLNGFDADIIDEALQIKSDLQN